MTGRLFFSLIRLRLQEEGIHEHSLLEDPTKSLIQPISLSDINVRRDRCSKSIFIGSQVKVLVSFGRRIGARSTLRAMFNILSRLYVDGIVFIRI